MNTAATKHPAAAQSMTAPKQHKHQKVSLHRPSQKKLVAVTPPAQTAPADAQPVAVSPVASVNGRRALVLDSSYRPIDVINWRRAIVLDMFDKVDVLEYFEDVTVRSPRASYMIPAVCRVRFYVKRNWKSARLSLSRRNIMLRDRFCCQYCGCRNNLTLDHVKPASKGGKFTWENMVTACEACNSKKGDSTLKQLGWRLRKQPKEPSAAEMSIIAGMGIADLRTPPKEWSNYIFPGQLPVLGGQEMSF